MNYDFSTAVNTEMIKLAAERGDRLLGAAGKNYPPGRSCDYRSMLLSCGHIQDIRPVHYRKTTATCQTCCTNKLNAVAKSQGLTLLSLDIVQYSNERLYIRNCGHTEIHSNDYLEKHKLAECQKCISSEVDANLKHKNFTVVGKPRDGYSISCNTCKNITVSRTDVARSGTPLCMVCFSELLKKEATTVGFTYLSEREPDRVTTASRTTNYRWYSCNTCSNIDTFSHIAMRLNNVRCTKCYLERRKSEAVAQGMEYLGWSKGMMHNYRLPCGCEREIQPQAVLRGIWACKIHDNTHYHRPSGIYLLEIKTQDFSWLKFGFAKDIGIRIKGYGLPEDATIEVIFNIKVDTGYEALEVEKSIHRDLINERIDPSLMKEKYMTFTGHTECYPLSTSPLIISKMKGFYEQKF